MSNYSSAFGQKTTAQLEYAIRPYAWTVLRELYPSCKVKPVTKPNNPPHPLDKYCGIDTLLFLECGGVLTVQEKYRENKFYTETRYRVDHSCPDFTQNYKIAVGTEHEANGEWFHLAAQLYFYAWATPNMDGLAAWMLMNIYDYVQLVEQAGGLDAIGKLCNNDRHSRTSFYAIPVNILRPAIMASYNLFESGDYADPFLDATAPHDDDPWAW